MNWGGGGCLAGSCFHVIPALTPNPGTAGHFPHVHTKWSLVLFSPGMLGPDKVHLPGSLLLHYIILKTWRQSRCPSTGQPLKRGSRKEYFFSSYPMKRAKSQTRVFSILLWSRVGEHILPNAYKHVELSRKISRKLSSFNFQGGRQDLRKIPFHGVV